MIHQAAVPTTAEMHREAPARHSAHMVVRRGDTLSGIAAKYRIEWPGLYEANHKVIGANPSLLNVGEHLRIPSAQRAVRLAARYRADAVPQPQPVAVQPVSAQPVEATAPVQQTAAPVQQAPAQTAAPTAAQTSAAPGSFQQCVISRESGCDSQVMNSSGHYGLYQFSYGTWVASGGNPADFGHASAAEQNQVFSSAYAQYGTSPWGSFDGC